MYINIYIYIYFIGSPRSFLAVKNFVAQIRHPVRGIINLTMLLNFSFSLTTRPIMPLAQKTEQKVSSLFRCVLCVKVTYTKFSEIVLQATY